MRIDFAITKFLPPKSSRPLVLRERLHALDDCRRCKLVLACAPAGFGKTTFLGQCHAWLLAGTMKPCWLSLESKDRDPGRLLLGIVRSIQTIHADFAQSLSGLIDIRPDAEIDRLADALINEIAACEREIALLLDDYHEVDGEPASQLMSRLLTLAPANLLVCIASRHIPSLKLSALRVRDEILEISAADLRFSAEETRQFMCEIRGHRLTEHELRMLHEQTEGWIAALQLASLSMERPRADGGALLLSGSHREIADYLTADLFAQLPEQMQSFLLSTSILDQMTPELCNRITGRTDSAALLREIERKNLFLIALDEQREWYRYHHLFRSFLRSQLAQRHPDRFGPLCRTASDWLSERGLAEEAIDYARKSGDILRMAELTELFAAEHIRHGRIMRLLSWIREIPAAVVAHRPWLSLYHAYALFHLRRIEELEAVLAQGAAAIARGRESGEPYRDEERRDFEAKAAAIRLGARGIAAGDPGLIDQTARLLEEHPVIEPTYFCTLLNVLGYLQIADGRFDAASGTLEQARAANERHDFVYGMVYADCFLGLCEAAQGRLASAIEFYARAETVAATRSGPHSLGHDLARLLRGVALLEQNRMDDARSLIETSAAIASDFGPVEIHTLAHTALSRLAAADGDLAAALGILDRTISVTRPSSCLVPRLLVTEQRTRLLLADGQTREAVRVAEHVLEDGDQAPTASWNEAASLRAVIRCRLDIACGRAMRAIAVSTTLQELAGRSGRRYAHLKLLILEIKAHLANHHTQRAQQRLLDAFRMIFPEQYARIFMEEIPGLASLLKDLLRNEPGSRDWIPQGLKTPAESRAQSGAESSRYFLIEPLSAREREILSHLAKGKSNQQIADEMRVAVNTIKWHVQNIFGKLGVSNRTAATLAAQQLELT